MQPIQVMTIFIMALSCAGVMILFIARDKKTTVKRYPSPSCEVMKWYNNDYIIIARELEQARNVYHLDAIRDAIIEFKYRYKNHQESITLKTDVNRLTRQWKEMKTSFKIRMAIF